MIALDITEKNFGTDRILAHCALQVAAGETVGVVGESGIGKSTLLRIAAGLDTAFAGSVTRSNSIAMVFQEPNLLPWRTVAENVRLASKASASQIATALADVGLEEKAQHFPGQLSLGQQRRAALARAFAMQPEVLILDEPFTSLDPDRAAEALDLTRALIKRHRPATLFVTHNMAEARSLCDRVLRLSGHPAGLSPLQVVKNTESISSFRRPA